MDDNKNPFEEQENAETEGIESIDEQSENQNADTDETNEDEQSKEDNADTKYEELNNKYIRLAADFDNFRKRTASEKEELSKYTTVELLKKITSSLDTFDRAQDSLKEIDDVAKVKEGWEVAYKQLKDTLSKIGLVEIDALGSVFNPNEHEAITQVETDEYEPDCVAVVAQKGYKYQDKVVRAALVGVAKNKENE